MQTGKWEHFIQGNPRSKASGETEVHPRMARADVGVSAAGNDCDDCDCREGQYLHGAMVQ